MTQTARGGAGRALVQWFDSWSDLDANAGEDPRSIDWARVIPFVALHLACGLVIWVGFSWTALVVALAAYAVRMFAITAFYHRYFSHRTFKTSRAMQFVFALIGSTAVQRGPIWWASHHRAHHRSSDTPADVHSPREQGFWWSHIGWIVARLNFAPRLELVPDLVKFPELRFLDRFDALVPVLSIGGFYLLGMGLAAAGFQTTPWQIVIWGFCISTIVTHHVTFTINSLAHVFGSRPYATGDDSRNNLVLSLLTFGEGWHNNHHRYPGSVRQGFRWWQIDLSYYGLWFLSKVGLVWRLNPVPSKVVAEGRKR